VPDPRAPRVEQVAVEVPDADGIDWDVGVGGKPARGRAPCVAPPATSRNRPGATSFRRASRLPSSSSIQAWGSGEPGRVDGS
jgi:hypothetical protein